MNLENIQITVQTRVQGSLEQVWNCWTKPIHIMHWNQASDDWQTSFAVNDLRVGGRFCSRMEARDGSFGFDFEGEYEAVEYGKRIAYRMDDDRRVELRFEEKDGEVIITETFDAEKTNPLEMQKEGWQSILNSFKRHVEGGKVNDIHFEIRINAPLEKVYKTMIDKAHFTSWTAAFNPTSRFEGSWDKNADIDFIGCDENGNEGGMVSRIRENMPGRFISIEHLGMWLEGKKVLEGPMVEGWKGAFENYTFVPEGNGTLLIIDMDSNLEMEAYFKEMWPKALDKLKEICQAEL